jgi:hypothetical protein
MVISIRTDAVSGEKWFPDNAKLKARCAGTAAYLHREPLTKLHVISPKCCFGGANVQSNRHYGSRYSSRAPASGRCRSDRLRHEAPFSSTFVLRALLEQGQREQGSCAPERGVGAPSSPQPVLKARLKRVEGPSLVVALQGRSAARLGHRFVTVDPANPRDGFAKLVVKRSGYGKRYRR